MNNLDDLKNLNDLKNVQDAPPIARPVEILTGIRAVAAFMKISQEKVREIAQVKDSPLFRDENGVIRCEKAELWEWWKMTERGETLKM